MIFLVDASVYVFRAYHSQLPDMVDCDGNPVHAVFGFARFLCDLMERIRPRYIGVAFDQRLSTSYRNRIYPAYKAHREPAPAGLARQFEYCRELCRHLGLRAFVDPEFEADDIIGTLSCLMRAEGIRSAFITRDKDLAQLVRDGDLLWDFGARTQLGYRDISRRFGAMPESYADFLALTGDACDNIPGVPGIGPKIAATLMRKFGSLDELYANIGRVASLGLRGGSALGERLAAHRESAFLARRLTRIVCDMPLGVRASDLRPGAPDLAALQAFYDRLGFGPLLRRQGDRLAGQLGTGAIAAAAG